MFREEKRVINALDFLHMYLEFNTMTPNRKHWTSRKLAKAPPWLNHLLRLEAHHLKRPAARRPNAWVWAKADVDEVPKRLRRDETMDKITVADLGLEGGGLPIFGKQSADKWTF